MTKLAVLVSAIAVAVFATAALSGNAGVQRQASGQRERVVSLQKQVNELRNELICLEAVAGDAYEQDWFVADSAAAPKAQAPVNDGGVCGRLGIRQLPDTSTSSVFPQPFRQLIARAFGR
jgi:hypothetical protein